MKKIKHWLLLPFTWLAALIFLIEEAIWDWTAAWMARLGTVQLVHAVERHISKLSPYGAFIAFLLPLLILEPAKLLGLHAIAEGHWIVGGLVFVIAKIIGFALFSRIFNLTRPALLQLAWFARLYNFVMYYRNRIHAYLDQWAAYQRLKQHLRNGVAALRGLIKRNRN